MVKIELNGASFFVENGVLQNIVVSEKFDGELILPNEVTEIKNVFGQYRKQIKKIVLHDKVKCIHNESFNGFEELREINIPESVEEIGNRAFENCTKLKHLIFPKSLKELGSGVCLNCVSLEDVALPENIKILPVESFMGCKSLQGISIPDNVLSISENCFLDCISLKNVHLPRDLQYIGPYAFNYCSMLDNIVCPPELEMIDFHAFDHCENLTSCILNDGIVEIGDNGFSCCKNLLSLTFPDSLQKIGARVCMNCSRLTSVTLPKNLVNIPNCAFDNCNSLLEIKNLETIKNIEKDAFHNCFCLLSINLSQVEKIQSRAFFGCQRLRNVSFGKSLKQIDNYAFNRCGLVNLEVPNSVEYIGDYVFDSNDNLKNVSLPWNLQYLGKTEIDFFELQNLLMTTENRCDRFDFNKIQLLTANKTNHVVVLHEDNGKSFCSYIKDNNLCSIEKNKIFEGSNQHNHLDKVYVSNYPDLVEWNTQKLKTIPAYFVINNMPRDLMPNFNLNNNLTNWIQVSKMANFNEERGKIALFKSAIALGVFSNDGKQSARAKMFLGKVLQKFNEYSFIRTFSDFDVYNVGYQPQWADFFITVSNGEFNCMVTNIYDRELEQEVKVDLLSTSYNNFKRLQESFPNLVVHTRQNNERLTIEKIIHALTSVQYENVDSRALNLSEELKNYGYNQQEFEKLQKIYLQGLGVSSILKVKSDDTNNKVRYELLKKSNPLCAILGDITNCCQKLDGAGESCMTYGMTKENSGFVVFKVGEEKKDILGQAWVWYDEKTKTICLDNIEIPFAKRDICEKKLAKSFISCVERFSKNIMNEMSKNGYQVEKVTMGLGANDYFALVPHERYNKPSCVYGLSGYAGYSDASTRQVVLCEQQNNLQINNVCTKNLHEKI